MKAKSIHYDIGQGEAQFSFHCFISSSVAVVCVGTPLKVTKSTSIFSDADQSRYRVWDYPIKELYGSVFETIKASGMVRSASDGFQKVMEDEEATFAFIHDSSQVNLEFCKVYQSHEVITNSFDYSKLCKNIKLIVNFSQCLSRKDTNILMILKGSESIKISLQIPS